MNTVTLSIEKATGYVRGSIGQYHFFATVFDEPSEYGIDGGRISKLFVYTGFKTPSQRLCVSYDRQWEQEPETKDALVATARLLFSLQGLPSGDA